MSYSSLSSSLSLCLSVFLFSSVGCVVPYELDFEDSTPSWNSEPPTPPGILECMPVASLVCGERISGDTAGSFGTSQVLDGYPAAVGNFGGPEQSYTFVAEADEDVVVRFVDPNPAELNHDLFVLESTDGSCRADEVTQRGFNELEFEVLKGRSYIVIVDAPIGEEGSFQIELDCLGETAYDAPSDYYWKPAVGCEQAVLADYRACLQDEDLLDDQLQPILPLADSFWDSDGVTAARSDCFDANPDVALCATLKPHDSGLYALLGLTNDPHNILPEDPADADDTVDEDLAGSLSTWTPDVLSRAELAGQMHDYIPESSVACSPSQCPLGGPEFVSVYGPQCGLDYGELANLDVSLDVAWEQHTQAQWAVDGLLARRTALSQAIADTAVAIDSYNDSVISRLRLRGTIQIIWAAIGSTVTGNLTKWWSEGPKLYSVQRLMHNPIGGATYNGFDIALKAGVRDDAALVLIDYAIPTIISGQVSKFVNDFGEVLSFQDFATGVTQDILADIAGDAGPLPNASFRRATRVTLKGLPILGAVLSMQGVIDEAFTSLDGNPYLLLFDQQVEQIHVVRGRLQAARAARSAALARIEGLQTEYNHVEANCSRY